MPATYSPADLIAFRVILEQERREKVNALIRKRMSCGEDPDQRLMFIARANAAFPPITDAQVIARIESARKAGVEAAVGMAATGRGAQS